jgi:hypothetical protein
MRSLGGGDIDVDDLRAVAVDGLVNDIAVDLDPAGHGDRRVGQVVVKRGLFGNREHARRGGRSGGRQAQRGSGQEQARQECTGHRVLSHGV